MNSNKNQLPVQVNLVQTRYEVGGRQNSPEQSNMCLRVIVCDTGSLIHRSFFELTSVQQLLSRGNLCEIEQFLST